MGIAASTTNAADALVARPTLVGNAPATVGRPWRAGVAIALCAAVSIALVFLYPDSYQQDGGTHYLYARWAWVHPHDFVDVWGRPLFTFLYSIPSAIGGYPAAKLLTVVIAAATAWQTWRLATESGLSRPALVVPFLWLQPSFLLISSETMTEPLFALLLVIALRLQRAEQRLWAAAVISATVLTRPEGFFLCGFWAVWVLIERRDPRTYLPLRRIGQVAMLGAGLAAWLLAGRLIMNDWLFVVHNWPSNWSATVATYGRGKALDYYYRRAEVVGPLLIYPFAIGVLASLVTRRLRLGLAVVVVFFAVHSALRATGRFGSAGYPRYFVCVAPAIALLTLLGWNTLAAALRLVSRLIAEQLASARRWLGAGAEGLVAGAAVVVLAISLACDVCYVDDMPWSRDAQLVTRAHTWFAVHARPINGFAASQAYMCIEFRCDPDQRIVTPGPADATLAKLRAAPPGTLVVWDADTGPGFYSGVTADSIEHLGYTAIYSVADSLRGRFLPHLDDGRFVPRVMSWGWDSAPRVEHVWLLYR